MPMPPFLNATRPIPGMMAAPLPNSHGEGSLSAPPLIPESLKLPGALPPPQAPGGGPAMIPGMPGMPDLPPHGPTAGHEKEQGKAKGYKLPSLPGPLGLALAAGGLGLGGVGLFFGGKTVYGWGKNAWRKGRDLAKAKFSTLKNQWSPTQSPESAASPVNATSATASPVDLKEQKITHQPVKPEEKNGILKRLKKRLLFSPSPGTQIRSDSGRSLTDQDISRIAAAVESAEKQAEPPSGWWSRLPGPAKWGTIGGGLLTAGWGGIKGLAWVGRKMPAPEKVKTGLSAITHILGQAGMVGTGLTAVAGLGWMGYQLAKAAQKEDPNAPKPRKKAFEDEPAEPIKIVHLHDDPGYYYGRPYGMRRWTHLGNRVYGFHYPATSSYSNGLSRPAAKKADGTQAELEEGLYPLKKSKKRFFCFRSPWRKEKAFAYINSGEKFCENFEKQQGKKMNPISRYFDDCRRAKLDRQSSRLQEQTQKQLTKDKERMDEYTKRSAVCAKAIAEFANKDSFVSNQSRKSHKKTERLIKQLQHEQKRAQEQIKYYEPLIQKDEKILKRFTGTVTVEPPSVAEREKRGPFSFLGGMFSRKQRPTPGGPRRDNTQDSGSPNNDGGQPATVAAPGDNVPGSPTRGDTSPVAQLEIQTTAPASAVQPQPHSGDGDEEEGGMYFAS